jgi:hypothetical protein
MALGWGQFFGGIGKLFGKLPIQERKERWKNELDNLTKEKRKLLLGDCDEKKANRVAVIDERIAVINQLLKNSASD